MAFTLACRDVGHDCPHCARGETIEELWKYVSKHAKEVHGATDEQLNDPHVTTKYKAAIKEV